jgi:hypothetical protein
VLSPPAQPKEKCADGSDPGCREEEQRPGLIRSALDILSD